MISIAKPIIGEEERQAVLDVLDSGMIASGTVTNKFEEEFASYIGVKFGVATNNGTTALETALRALGAGVGVKVLTTPFSFIASTNAIVYAGATPVFADIDEKSFNISAESIEAKLQEDSDIRILLIVHLFGQPCDMDAIMLLVKKYDLLLLEDCAQAHGAEWGGQKIGSFGNAAAFSFYPTKNMTTSEGGMVLTNDENTARRCRMLVNHGMEKRYYHDSIGYNYRMTNISAAIGRFQLKKLDEWNHKRRGNAAFYAGALAKAQGVLLPECLPKAHHVYHQYTVKVPGNKRDELIRCLEENQIGYGVFYPLSIPEQRCYDGQFSDVRVPVTDTIKQEVLSIPVHPSLTPQDVSTVADVIYAFGGVLL